MSRSHSSFLSENLFQTSLIFQHQERRVWVGVRGCGVNTVFSTDNNVSCHHSACTSISSTGKQPVFTGYHATHEFLPHSSRARNDLNLVPRSVQHVSHAAVHLSCFFFFFFFLLLFSSAGNDLNPASQFSMCHI